MNNNTNGTYTEIDTVKVGTFLKSLRNNQGCSREKAAASANVSPDSLAGYERGHRLPPADALYALARLYGVTMEEILTNGQVPSGSSNAEQPSKGDSYEISQEEDMLSSAEHPDMNADTWIARKHRYFKIMFYAFICTLAIALAAWFIMIRQLRQQYLDEKSGPIEIEIQTFTLPEGETMYNDEAE